MHACLGPGPAARVGHVAAALSGSMLVHGGRTAPDQALGDLWLLDLSPKRTSSGESTGTGDAARWVCVDAKGTPPATRHRHSAVSVGGSLKVCRELLGRAPVPGKSHCHFYNSPQPSSQK